MDFFDSFKGEGNKFYKKCTDGFPASLWSENLNKALVNYETASRHATSDDQKASISKNLGMANAKHFDVAKSKDERVFYTLEALKKFEEALKFGGKKHIEWQDHIHDQCSELVEKAIHTFENEGRIKRVDICYKLRNNCYNLEKVIMEINSNITNLLFMEGVELTEKKDFKKALDCFENLSGPMLMAKSFAKKFKDFTLIEDLEDLAERRTIHLHRAQAMREKEAAKSLISNVLNADDELSIDMIWQAVDQFIFSMKICKGHDIELEAEINSHLGNIFDKLLKFEDKALKFYETSLGLANSLVPRIMTTIDWYKRAMDYLKAVQEKRNKEAEEKYKNMKAKYMEELKPQLDEIKAKSESLESKAFLEYLYKTFPPKSNPNAKVDQALAPKRQIQAALIFYHPDKNQNYDEKWIVLVTEITVYLNNHYYKYK